VIIYGTKATQLANERVTEKCPNCGTQNSIEMYVFQKYAHVFWIPLFPTGKTAVSECSHCKQVLKQKEMPAALKASYDNVKAQYKTPIWTFSGLALLAIAISLGVYTDKQDAARNAKLILEPKTGDIFEIRTAERNYTLYKVENVMGDSVLIAANNFETNKISGLNELKEKGFSNELYSYHKNELKKMLEEGEIMDIERQ
jgi:hypothetical protein